MKDAEGTGSRMRELVADGSVRTSTRVWLFAGLLLGCGSSGHGNHGSGGNGASTAVGGTSGAASQMGGAGGSVPGGSAGQNDSGGTVGSAGIPAAGGTSEAGGSNGVGGAGGSSAVGGTSNAAGAAGTGGAAVGPSCTVSTKGLSAKACTTPFLTWTGSRPSKRSPFICSRSRRRSTRASAWRMHRPGSIVAQSLAVQSTRRSGAPEDLPNSAKSRQFLVTSASCRDTAMPAMKMSPSWHRRFADTRLQISPATPAALSSNGKTSELATRV